MSDHIDQHLTQKGIIKNTFWIYAVTLLIAPMQYVVRIIIAHNIPLKEVWLVYSLLWLTGILAIYNDLGFREAIGYFYPKYLANKDYNKSKTVLIFTLVLQLVSSCIIAGLLWVFAGSIAQHYLNYPGSDIVIKIFGGYLFFLILYNFIDGIFMLYQDAFWNKILHLINYIVLLALTFLVPYGIFNYIGIKSNLTWFIVAQIIPSIVSIIIGVLVFLKKYRAIAFKWNFIRDNNEYKIVQKYALGVLITNNIVYLLSAIDIQISTYLFGTTTSGLYSYGMMLTNMFVTLLSPIGLLLYPMVSHLRARSREETMKKVFYAVINYMWLIAMIWSFFLFAYSNQLMSILFGSEYGPAGTIVKRNLLFVPFGVLSGIIFMIYAGLGLIKKRLKMLIVVFILNIIGNFVFSYFLHINGIALNIWLTWLALFIYGYIDLRKEKIELQLDYKLFIKNIIIWSIVLILLHYLFTYIKIDFTLDRFYSIKWIAIAATVYLSALFITNFNMIKNIISTSKQLMKLRKWAEVG